jgi:hypothetical protein
MKNIFLFISMVVFFISCNISHAEEIAENNLLYRNIRDNTCIPLFTALKDGDVEAIKDCFSSKKCEKHKDLLDQGEDYSNFLKDFYRNADFLVKRIIREKETTFVDIIIYFPNGIQSTRRWLLIEEKRKEGDKIWKVENEIIDPL